MKKKSQLTAILELNLAIIFISTSGVLGKYIDLPVPAIIFLRSIIAGILLFCYVKLRKISLKIAPKDRLTVLIGGVFLGAHWMTYFYALKFSNVAIAMLSLYTFPTVTAILEPIFLKNKFQKIHLVLGAVVLFGIYLLAPDFQVGNDALIGVGFGFVSAVFYALRNILLKPKISKYNQSVLMMNQLGTISVLLIPSLGFLEYASLLEYIPETILLAVLTTAIGHTLFVYSLKNFSTTSASLMSSLQPIYGIILAFFFLKEIPNLSTVIGGAIIVSTVVFESIRINKKED